MTGEEQFKISQRTEGQEVGIHEVAVNCPYHIYQAKVTSEEAVVYEVKAEHLLHYVKNDSEELIKSVHESMDHMGGLFRKFIEVRGARLPDKCLETANMLKSPLKR